MVCIGLVAQQDALLAGRIGSIGILGYAKPRDDRVETVVCFTVRRRHQILVFVIVVDKEVARAGKVRREGHAQHASLAAVLHTIADIEKGRHQNATILDNLDASTLFHDKKTARSVAGMGHKDGLAQASDDRLKNQSAGIAGSLCLPGAPEQGCKHTNEHHSGALDWHTLRNEYWHLNPHIKLYRLAGLGYELSIQYYYCNAGLSSRQL